jgi:hypothetical protein
MYLDKHYDWRIFFPELKWKICLLEIRQRTIKSALTEGDKNMCVSMTGVVRRTSEEVTHMRSKNLIVFYGIIRDQALCAASTFCCTCNMSAHSVFNFWLGSKQRFEIISFTRLLCKFINKINYCTIIFVYSSTCFGRKYSAIFRKNVFSWQSSIWYTSALMYHMLLCQEKTFSLKMV